MKKHILHYFLMICMTLVLMELCIRAAGFVLSFQQKQRNLEGIEANQFTILTLGESTTADLQAGRDASWPRQLEKSLKLKGYNVKVINEAEPGIMTTSLMLRLPQFVEKYSPNVVISMMGINDAGPFWMAQAGQINDGSFLTQIKLIKLVRLLWELTANKQIENLQPKTVPPYHFGYPNFMKLVDRIKKKEPEADVEIELFLKGKSDLEKSQFYSFLEERLRPPWGNPPEKFLLATKYSKIAVKYSLLVSTEPDKLALYALMQGDTKTCEDLASEYLRQNVEPYETALSRLATCLGTENPTLRLLFQRYGNKFLIKSGRPTEYNYNFLYQTAKKNDFCLIAMQYPRLPLENLKAYFRPHVEESFYKTKVVFAENVHNFALALQTKKEEEIFTDLFAYPVGHTTYFGHTLIANSAETALMPLLESNRCVQK